MPPLDDKSDIEAPSVEVLITKGKRDLKCLDPQSAVECFAKACEMLAQQLGDLHDDLAMPNLLYGTALLELARMENNVFGEQVKDKELSSDEENEEEDGDEEENEEEDGDEEEKEKDKSKSEDENGNEATDELKETGNKEESAEGMEKGDAPETAKESGEKAEELQPSTSAGVTHDPEEGVENDDQKDGGEISTLQLAWEVVEVARSIFSKHDDAEHRLKCAECLEKLSEIGKESENFDSSIRDLLECLEIRKKDDSTNLRLIAVTHFQLALAYSYKNDTKSADDSFGKSLEYLEESKAQYESELRALDKEDELEKDRISVLEVYISEVSGLIKDIEERRKEICDSVVENKDIEEPQSKTLESDAPVDDISHLIKKKRPADEQNESLPAKKARVENVDEKEEKA